MLILRKSKSTVDDRWTETSLTGLNILLILLGHSNIHYSSQASIRILTLLNARSFIGREEAAYVLSTVNQIFSSFAREKSSDYQVYLFPLMKLILDKSSAYLPIHGTIGEEFMSKSTYEELCEESSLMKDNRWQLFIDEITQPYAEHYQLMSIRPFKMNMGIWWNSCQEMLNQGILRRNRDIEIEKIRFQVGKYCSERRRTDLFAFEFRLTLFEHGNNVIIRMNAVLGKFWNIGRPIKFKWRMN